MITYSQGVMHFYEIKAFSMQKAYAISGSHRRRVLAFADYLVGQNIQVEAHFAFYNGSGFDFLPILT